MAKTVFQNGTIVLPEWLNKIFGNSGHRHDGRDEDGSAPKINLASEVAGVLPANQLGAHHHTLRHQINFVSTQLPQSGAGFFFKTVINELDSLVTLIIPRLAFFNNPVPGTDAVDLYLSDMVPPELRPAHAMGAVVSVNFNYDQLNATIRFTPEGNLSLYIPSDLGATPDMPAILWGCSLTYLQVTHP